VSPRRVVSLPPASSVAGPANPPHSLSRAMPLLFSRASTEQPLRADLGAAAGTAAARGGASGLKDSVAAARLSRRSGWAGAETVTVTGTRRRAAFNPAQLRLKRGAVEAWDAGTAAVAGKPLAQRRPDADADALDAALGDGDARALREAYEQQSSLPVEEGGLGDADRRAWDALLDAGRVRRRARCSVGRWSCADACLCVCLSVSSCR
jgi:hypothetical protein